MPGGQTNKRVVAGGCQNDRVCEYLRVNDRDDPLDIDAILRAFQRGASERVRDDAVTTHADLGLAYLEMGLLKDAAAEFSLVLKQDPTHEPARAALHLIKHRLDPEASGPLGTA